MSNYHVIADISETLKKILWERIEVDADIYPQVIDSEDQITLVSPEEMDVDGPKKLSLFLYQVIENGHISNREMLSVDHLTRQYPPLVVDLLYLVTCNTGDLKKDHLLMGKVMQVYHDHAVLRGSVLQGSLSGSDEEFRLVLYRLPFEETLNLWQSFREKSFRLTICYHVTSLKIDSTRRKTKQRTLEKAGSYGRAPGVLENRA